MDLLGQIACVFLCLVGGVYATWLLVDCYRRFHADGDNANRCSARKRRSARINWLLQLVGAVTFVVIASAMVTSTVRQHLPLLRQDGASEKDAVCSVQVPGMRPLPPHRLEYDHHQPERPIIGADLCNLPITDADIQALVNCAKDIEYLNLAGTQITDEAILYLKRLPRLTYLALDRTSVSDAGLEQLADLEDLESLTLCGTSVNDAGLAHFSGLTNLQTLLLHQTSITDAGLDSLETLKRLEYLGFANTRITDHGIRQLASKLPRLAEGLSDDK